MYGVSSLIVTGITLPLLSVVAVFLRFYVRLYVKPSTLRIDDWLIVVSCFIACALGANQVVGAVFGEIGRDSSPTEPQRVAIQSKVDQVVLIVEKVVYGTTKLSVLFFYRRIFVVRTFQRINNILIVLIAVWAISFLFAEVGVCGIDSVDGHSCQAAVQTLLAFAITDVIGDIAIFASPYPYIKKLRISSRDKIGLCAIFLLGTLSFIAGVIRLGFVVKNFTVYFHYSAQNGSGSRSPPTFWTNVEISIGVLAACLPPLGPLLKRAPTLRQTSQSISQYLASHLTREKQQSLRSEDTLTGTEGVKTSIEGGERTERATPEPREREPRTVNTYEMV